MGVVPFGAVPHWQDVVGEVGGLVPGRRQGDEAADLFLVGQHLHPGQAVGVGPDRVVDPNPVWVHPSDASRLGIHQTGDLIRVETEIGYFVAKAWITQGIRPGVIACSHHMGRWKLTGHKQVSPGGMMATVDLNHDDDGWTMRAADRLSRTRRQIRTPPASGGPTPACTRT